MSPQRRQRRNVIISVAQRDRRRRRQRIASLKSITAEPHLKSRYNWNLEGKGLYACEEPTVILFVGARYGVKYRRSPLDHRTTYAIYRWQPGHEKTSPSRKIPLSGTP